MLRKYLHVLRLRAPAEVHLQTSKDTNSFGTCRDFSSGPHALSIDGAILYGAFLQQFRPSHTDKANPNSPQYLLTETTSSVLEYGGNDVHVS